MIVSRERFFLCSLVLLLTSVASAETIRIDPPNPSESRGGCCLVARAARWTAAGSVAM